MADTPEHPYIELEGSVTAPILMFDEAPLYGIMGGIGRITLSAILQDEDGQGGVKQRRKVVVHLRGNGTAFHALREAINGMEMLATPAQGGEKPN